jgi:hypothetical protein
MEKDLAFMVGCAVIFVVILTVVKNKQYDMLCFPHQNIYTKGGNGQYSIDPVRKVNIEKEFDIIIPDNVVCTSDNFAYIITFNGLTPYLWEDKNGIHLYKCCQKDIPSK